MSRLSIICVHAWTKFTQSVLAMWFLKVYSTDTSNSGHLSLVSAFIHPNTLSSSHKLSCHTHQVVISEMNLLDVRMKYFRGTHTNKDTVVTQAMEAATTSQYAVRSPPRTCRIREAKRSMITNTGTLRQANCRISKIISLTVLPDNILTDFETLEDNEETMKRAQAPPLALP